MRIAVLIPDRGDRPKFMQNCFRMMSVQTLKPETILVVDDPPLNDKCDITWRYRTGYERLRGEGYDVIAFIENDDWYSPEYLEQMAEKWEFYRRPDLLGIDYTIYYHVKLKKYFTFQHIQRASAMGTFIKPDLNIIWPQDHDPYTDQWLWVNRCGIGRRMVFTPHKPICVGMKHGEGMAGGIFHTTKLNRYTNEDNGFLQRILDSDSYNFYSQF